jgi:hypothetical protein
LETEDDIQLDDFIYETLKQILDGVAKAKNYAPQVKGEIGPSHTSSLDKIREVSFDVAITAAEGSKEKAGIGIFVAGVGIGSQSQQEVGNVAVSRIQFKVPIKYP